MAKPSPANHMMSPNQLLPPPSRHPKGQPPHPPAPFLSQSAAARLILSSARHVAFTLTKNYGGRPTPPSPSASFTNICQRAAFGSNISSPWRVQNGSAPYENQQKAQAAPREELKILNWNRMSNTLCRRFEAVNAEKRCEKNACEMRPNVRYA